MHRTLPGEAVTIAGVAPENYHSTSMYPEYFKINGKWTLAKESRMDSSVVLCDDGELKVVENRNLKLGDRCDRGPDGQRRGGHLPSQYRVY